MAEPTLDRDAFEAWLRSRPADAVVGYASKSNCCPLASYLLVSGAPKPRVRKHSFQAHEDGLRHALPDWAADFVAGIDFSTPDLKAVTAAEALVVLEEVSR